MQTTGKPRLPRTPESLTTSADLQRTPPARADRYQADRNGRLRNGGWMLPGLLIGLLLWAAIIALLGCIFWQGWDLGLPRIEEARTMVVPY